MTRRPIDHIVHCVGDLAAARDLHRRLGFTLTPEAHHPFGTGNSLVQLDGNFIELLAIADPAAIRPAEPGHFSIGAYSAQFLSRRRGISMLVFASGDARRDHAEFVKKGLDTYAPFDFSRRAKLPDGSEVTVGFSLAFVTHRDLPDAVFFVCQQLAPQYFWKPEYQQHANTALVLDEIVLTAPRPAALAEFFAALHGAQSLRRTPDALTVETGRGRISVLEPEPARARFGALPADPATPHFVGYRVLVRDLGVAARILSAADVPHRADGKIMRVAAADNFGAALEFAEAPRG